MKDCYEVTKNIKVIGVLEVDADNKKYIRIDKGKDIPDKIVDFDELTDNLIGNQIKIETILDID